jgi:hypothetical protein
MQRSRSHSETPAPEIKAKKRGLKLSFDETWLSNHPLIHADLLAEKQRLSYIDFRLRIKKL